MSFLQKKKGGGFLFPTLSIHLFSEESSDPRKAGKKET